MAPKKLKQQGKINLKLRKDTKRKLKYKKFWEQQQHPRCWSSTRGHIQEMVADDKLKNATAKSEPGIEMTPGNHVPTQYPSKIMSFECPVVVYAANEVTN